MSLLFSCLLSNLKGEYLSRLMKLIARLFSPFFFFKALLKMLCTNI